VLACTFANLNATAEFVAKLKVDELLLICAGTYEEAAYEDTLVAGALGDLLWSRFASGAVADSAQIAHQLFLSAKNDLPGAVQACSRNARRLLAMRELSDDVEFCLRRDTNKIVAQMFSDGTIRQGK
jgi:phosphosulfolactate phosphohydrolase-like enzyme